jgi:hypothetical protein
MISLYDQDGKKLWSADLGPRIAQEFRMFQSFREPGTPAGLMNIGIWDVYFQRDEVIVRIMGTHSVGINMKTGLISDEANP